MPTASHHQGDHDYREYRGAYLIGLDLSNTDASRPRATTRRRQANTSRMVGARHLAHRRIGWRGWIRRLALALLTAACLAALFGVPAWALTSPTWRVRHIVIQGTSDPTLIAQITRLPLAGCDIFRCNLARDARLIVASPLIAQASVAPLYPATLVVSVRPRHIALLWRVGSLTLAFGADGKAMGMVGPDGRLALDPTQQVENTPTIPSVPSVLISGMSAVQAEQIDHIDENLIVMASQLRLPLIADALNLAPEAVTLTYQWATSQGFVSTTSSGLRIVFGGPEASAVLANEMANDNTNPPSGAAAPTGATPTAANVAQGVRLQLAVLRALVAWLSRMGQRAIVIDLRWGAYPYYLVAS